MIFTHALVFDTNVFKRILRKGHEGLYKNLFVSLNKLVNPGNQYQQFYNSITPFLFLEYLGFSLPNLDSTKIKTDGFKEKGFKVPPAVFKQACDLYESFGELSEASLRKKFEENKKYHSDEAALLYEDVVGKVANKGGFDRYLKQNLALDFTYRFPFSRFISGDELTRVHINTMLDIYRAHKSKLNLTQMRGVLKLCDDLATQVRGQEISSDAEEIFDSTQGIKGFRDLADLDLVQLACLGTFIQDKKFPIIAITADPKASVVSRITLFKSTFTFFNKEMTDKGYIKQDAEHLEEVDEKPGMVGFVNLDKCEIEEIISVSDVPLAN